MTVRVGVVIPRYAPVVGGAERQARLLNGLIEDRGRASIVFVATGRTEPSLPRQEVIDGIVVHRLGLAGAGPMATLSFYGGLGLFLVKRRTHLDLIHVHTAAVTGLVCAAVGLVTRRPVLLKLTSRHALAWPFSRSTPTIVGTAVERLWHALARWLTRRASFVALTDAGEREIRGAAGSRRPSVARIGNGVDVHTFRPDVTRRLALRRALKVGDEPIVLYAGRFTRGKQLDVIVEAVGRLAESVEPRPRALLVGSARLQPDGLTRRELEDMKSLPWVDVQELTDDPAAYFQLADVYVQASRSEGLSNAVLEALACGLPCALSDIPEHVELVEGDRDLPIWLHRPGDPRELAASIEAALEWSSGCKSRSSLLPENMSLEEVAAAYEELYEGLVS